MQLLICGIHRSGTSAVAHMLSESCRRTLLEDPDWAMTGRLVDVTAPAEELARWDILKCPRMTEVLPAALDAYPQARAAVMVRDPRDVLCSILEKVNAGMPTRMLEFSRLGVSETGAAGFAQAYVTYARTILSARAAAGAERVHLIRYEQFCTDRPAGIAALAAWLGWTCDREVCESIQSRQLGPFHTKHPGDQSIKGAGRWRTELSGADQAALGPALDAYTSLCEAAR
ncbi:sulfotransferase family protein [Streptomyces inhibens]|uniref:sulfotransferase family protein n=1 Tax=Streptomyces inhibens TaxID=2293571 RepID=UPI00402ACA53